VNEPSVDALSVTLIVSAFVEIDMPTTVQKMIRDDLTIMSDLEADSCVISLSYLEVRLNDIFRLAALIYINQREVVHEARFGDHRWLLVDSAPPSDRLGAEPTRLGPLLAC